MSLLEFNCKVLTPMFLGGADQEQISELRPASIKGSMRYWFRALAGKICADNIDQVRTLESRVFGDTDQAGAIRIKVRALKGLMPVSQQWEVPEGVAYLGGMALFMRGKMSRPCLPPGGEFHLVLAGPEKELNAAYASLLMLSRFGGIGSRSRKGFGSFDIMGEIPNGWPCPNMPPLANLESKLKQDFKWCDSVLQELYKKVINKEIPSHNTDIPQFPSFTRIKLMVFDIPVDRSLRGFGTFHIWPGPMSEVGRALRKLRESEKDSRDIYLTTDYVDVIRDAMARHNVNGRDLHNDAFGLPLPFRSRTTGNKAVVTWCRTDSGERTGDGEGQKRRASPLWVSFGVPHGSSGMIASFLLLDSEYLPDGAEEVVDVGNRRWSVKKAQVKELVGKLDKLQELLPKKRDSEKCDPVAKIVKGGWQ